MPLGQAITYTTPPIRFNKDDPAERFTARYPTVAELTAQREAIAALRKVKDKPGDPEPVQDNTGFMRVNYEMTLPLLTGYSVNGITIEDFGWKEALETDGRYMEVVAAIGFELFRGANFESDG